MFSISGVFYSTLEAWNICSMHVCCNPTVYGPVGYSQGHQLIAFRCSLLGLYVMKVN